MHYTTKVWLSTVFLSPVIFWIVLSLVKSENISTLLALFPVVFASIITGFIFSIPTMLLFWKTNQRLSSSNSEVWKINTLLSILSTVGIFLTFFIIDSSIFHNFRSFLLPLSYMVVMTASIWFFTDEDRVI